MDIANDKIPHIMKVSCDGHDSGGIARDSDCYGLLLQFYDGICQWEEGSPTPVLHIGWATHLVFSLSKFEAGARQTIDVSVEDKETNGCQDEKSAVKAKLDEKLLVCCNNNITKENPVNKMKDSFSGEEEIKTAIEELESRVGGSDTSTPMIAALAQACGESILNPDYLLTGGEPFAKSPTPSIGKNDEFTQLSKTTFPDLKSDTILDDIYNLQTDSTSEIGTPFVSTPVGSRPHSSIGNAISDGHTFTLYSAKMKGLKDLLTTNKLNGSAIKLQLTAQSQVYLKHKAGDITGTRSKRARRV